MDEVDLKESTCARFFSGGNFRMKAPRRTVERNTIADVSKNLWSIGINPPIIHIDPSDNDVWITYCNSTFRCIKNGRVAFCKKNSYIKINVNSEKIVFLVHQRILYDKIVKFLSFEVGDAISLFNQHVVPRYFAKRPANSLNLQCSAVRIVVSGNPRVRGLSFSCGYAPWLSLGLKTIRWPLEISL